MVKSQRIAIVRTEENENNLSGGSKKRRGSGGSQPCFCWNACIIEETEGRRLVFSVFSSGECGEMHLGTWGMREIEGGISHCLIRQLKDTSAEEMRICH